MRYVERHGHFMAVWLVCVGDETERSDFDTSSDKSMFGLLDLAKEIYL